MILLVKREGRPRAVSFHLLHQAERIIFSLVKLSRKLHDYPGAKIRKPSPRHLCGIALQTKVFDPRMMGSL